jgi:uncharacterized protein (TIGR00369 family)
MNRSITLTPIAPQLLKIALSPVIKVQDPDFVRRVTASFAKQAAMTLIGAQLVRVEAGEVEVHLPFDSKLAQQHGFVHAGMLTSAMDSACGYAASTVMPASAGVLTIELKVNLLAPVKGDYFVCIGQVIKAGRTVVFTDGQAFSVTHDETNDTPVVKKIATMSASMMTVTDREGITT